MVQNVKSGDVFTILVLAAGLVKRSVFLRFCEKNIDD